MSTALVIQVDGLDKLIAKYGTAKVNSAVRDALNSTTMLAASLMKEKLAGQHHVTGFLASSIAPKMIDGNNAEAAAARGGGKVYYAMFVEKGTGVHGPAAHPIVPKKAKRLAWHPKTVTGTPITKKGKIVRPSVAGQKPVKFAERTIKQDKGKLTLKFQNTFKAKLGL